MPKNYVVFVAYKTKKTPINKINGVLKVKYYIVNNSRILYPKKL